MAKFKYLTPSKYRVLLTEVLPFELPAFISNKGFYTLSKKFGLKSVNGIIVATKQIQEPGLKDFLYLLNGTDYSDKRCFQYHISKENDHEGRCLAFIHPYHQLEIADFYDTYKESILVNCSRSSFSLRYPYKQTSFLKKKITNNYPLLSKQVTTDENDARSFFIYKHYNNINSFYSSYHFKQKEAKFGLLLKIDVKKCFETIRPEILPFALYGTEKGHEKSMATHFQRLQISFGNKNEGIVIGSEFSRLYSEMLFQVIDREIEAMLKKEYNLQNGRDYCFYRYVDDGFLFTKDKETRLCFFKSYIKCLGKYGMSENRQKREYYEHRPFVSSIEYARFEISRLIDNNFVSRNDTFEGYRYLQHGVYDIPMRIDAGKFISALRIVMKTSGVHYKDIASFAMMLLAKGFNTLAKEYKEQLSVYRRAARDNNIDKVGEDIYHAYRSHFSKYVIELIEILFYLTNNDLRVNNVLKLIPIVGQIVRSLDYILLPEDLPLKNQIFQKISNEVRALFINNAMTESNQIELLLLLDIVNELPGSFAVTEEQLERYLHMDTQPELESLHCISVIMLLHYIRDRKQYNELREVLCERIQDICEDVSLPGTYRTLMRIETLFCPYLDEAIKDGLLPENIDRGSLSKFLNKSKRLFVKWRKYNSLEEIVHKYSGNVY